MPLYESYLDQEPFWEVGELSDYENYIEIPTHLRNLDVKYTKNEFKVVVNLSIPKNLKYPIKEIENGVYEEKAWFFFDIMSKILEVDELEASDIKDICLFTLMIKTYVMDDLTDKITEFYTIVGFRSFLRDKQVMIVDTRVKELCYLDIEPDPNSDNIYRDNIYRPLYKSLCNRHPDPEPAPDPEPDPDSDPGPDQDPDPNPDTNPNPTHLP